MARVAATLALTASSAGSVLGMGVPSAMIAPGVEMPMLAFGSARPSFQGECTLQEAVEQWLKLGGRHVDTAYNYGTQPDVGKALKAVGVPREDLFLTTKLPGPIGKAKVIELFTKETLPELGVKYVDLLLVHWPCLDMKDFPNKCGEQYQKERLDTWEGLLELKKRGLIRAAGVSNFNTEQVEEIVAATGSGPAVNQVEWHLGYHNETLLADMKTRGVALAAWASLSGPTTSGPGGHPGISLGDSRLQPFAERHGASTAQIALRWSVHKGVVPVTGTCSSAHAIGDLAAFNFELSEQEIADLDALQAVPPGAQTVVV
jgi:diketogulonate reductase-like aldo/keto reductase